MYLPVDPMLQKFHNCPLRMKKALFSWERNRGILEWCIVSIFQVDDGRSRIFLLGISTEVPRHNFEISRENFKGAG